MKDSFRGVLINGREKPHIETISYDDLEKRLFISDAMVCRALCIDGQDYIALCDYSESSPVCTAIVTDKSMPRYFDESKVCKPLFVYKIEKRIGIRGDASNLTKKQCEFIMGHIENGALRCDTPSDYDLIPLR